MGFYYSLYELFNPVYKTDLNSYVDNHMIPQLKDLVTRYSPDLVWTDGEWDKPSKNWKSEQFLAWLFNESAVKNSVVVNDRWGSETRSKHGGIYTTEYGLVGEKEGIDSGITHPWEECRGIGTSFGYNRTENLGDYSTEDQLIRLLITTVSAGGNLLLDIGPAADGTIPVIMQQRLLEIGKWLKTNGEAIYGTRAFIKSKEDQSINAETNKNIFFTRKDKDLFVICIGWPKSSIVLKNSNFSGNATAQMLGTAQPVNIKQSGGSLIISLPALTPDDYQAAYVFRLKGVLK
jgi:alpha-L-fucosidase